MNSPIISIVVPLYNVEEHIVNCLNSIIAQRYTNYEVIIVNDGSTDQSEYICDTWIKSIKDKRFKLYNKSNGGLSDARNFGIKHCSCDSEYIIFIDSDDEITPNCLSLLIENASHDSMVIGTLIRCYKNRVPKIKKNNNKVFIRDIWHNNLFLTSLKSGLINSCCGNCYSLDIIRKYGLTFKKILPEDTFFNLEYLSIINSIVIVECPIYLYYIWSNSMSTRPKEEIYINYMLIQQRIYDKIDVNYRNAIDLFVYPQYRVNTIKFIKNGEYSLPHKYLGKTLIKNALAAYSPVSLADWILHFCLKHRLLKIAKFF